MSVALVKLIRQNTIGQRRQTIGTFSGPASYATGGDVNTIGNLTGGRIKEADSVRVVGVGSILYNIIVIFSSNGGVQTVKFVAIVIATGAEAANTTDLSAERWRIEVQGN